MFNFFLPNGLRNRQFIALFSLFKKTAILKQHTLRADSHYSSFKNKQNLQHKYQLNHFNLQIIKVML